MNYRMNKASNIFLCCFACFLGLVAVVCAFTNFARIEMIASVASVSGVLFTVADLFAARKNDSERIHSLFEKTNEKEAELDSLRKVRIREMKDYCQIKHKTYQTTSKINDNLKEPLVFTFEKALNIFGAIDLVLEKLYQENVAKKETALPDSLFCRYNMIRLEILGFAHDIFLVAGFTTALFMLVFYNLLELPPAFPNYLSVVGFALVMVIYASRDRAEVFFDTAVTALDEYVEDLKKSIEFEQRLMRLMKTALYKNEDSTPMEAEANLLLYISHITSADTD